MNKEIKQRIELIKKGKIPQGYQQTRAGLAPNDWVNGHISDILFNEKRTVPKPQNGYWRIGIRSHAKGTFHEFVENPDEVDMDELYVVKKDDLIINITFAWEHAIALADENDDGLLVSHRFPTYVFKKEQIPYFYLNVFVQNRFKELLALISPGGAGRNRVMSKKDFLQLPCFIPDFEEQQKIAEILMQCDKVIELYEQEIEEFKKLKKAYLRKMFPKKGKNVPELRFAGFTDHWEQRKLGDIGYTYTGLSGKTKEDFGHGQARFITYMNVFSNPVSNPNQTEPIEIDSKQNEVEVGDVFFTTSSETPEEVGMSSVLLEKQGTTYLNSFCFGFRPVKKVDNFYLACMLRSEPVREKITLLAQGISRYNISKNKVMEISVPMPSLEEQELIGRYFRELDNLITLHERKLEEQKNQKKSLMQLLLTGIVRVKS